MTDCRVPLIAAILCTAAASASGQASITLHAVDGDGMQANVGTVRLLETPYGLVFQPDLRNLAPGLHGFHVHENPSCGPGMKDGQKEAAHAAGEHLDPARTKTHGDPWGSGHLGDLPPLSVAADGTARQPVLAPRLKLADVRNRSLMVHAGGDNHADHPQPLGGGGARVACGVIDR